MSTFGNYFSPAPALMLFSTEATLVVNHLGKSVTEMLIVPA